MRPAALVHGSLHAARGVLALLVANRRLCLPFAGAALCVLVASVSPPLVSFVAIVGAFGLAVDGCLVVLPGGADGLRDHRQ